ncbi:MAG: hypothetical protein ACLGH3_03095 [Actinomycetota bacterium]
MKIFALALTLALGAWSTPAASRTLTVADHVRKMLSDAAGQVGTSIDPLLDLPLQGAGRHGSLRALIDEVGSVRMDEGPAGTPEIVVGNFLHIYVRVESAAPCTLRRVPSVVLADQLPSVGPPSPVRSAGRLEHVSGTYSAGLHLVAVADAAYGTGTSTDPQVGATTYARADTGIDHVGMWQTDETQITFFGNCLAIGVSDGLGVAQFQPGSFQGQQVPFPDIP